MTNPVEKKIIWPDARSFGLVLTHDVDRVRKSYQYFTHFLRSGRWYHVKSLFHSSNPYWTFNAIMELEERLGVRSTFFFLNESGVVSLFKPGTYSLFWGRYRVDEQAVRNIIVDLDKRGWEIGVHGSYHSYNDEKKLQQEKNVLESIVLHKIAGVRQHYLRLDIPNTWHLQKKVGFEYDASFGHIDKIGVKDDKHSLMAPFGDDFIAIPLTLMDVALFQHYPDLHEAWHKVQELIMDTKKSTGLMTILWHTERFNAEEFPGHIDFYKRIIEFCRSENAWIGTCGEVVRLARY